MAKRLKQFINLKFSRIALSDANYRSRMEKLHEEIKASDNIMKKSWLLELTSPKNI